MPNIIKKSLRHTAVIVVILSYTASSAMGDVYESWMEIYSGDSKVGYNYKKVNNDKGLTILNEKTLINLDVLGLQTEMFIEGDYNLDTYYVVSFTYNVTSDSIGLKLKGRIENGKLKLIDIEKNKEQYYKLNNRYLAPSMLPEYIVAKGLHEGNSFEVYLFDPLNIFTGYDPDGLKAEIRVFGKEKIKTELGEFTTNKVIVKFLGAESVLWLTGDGIEIKENFEPSLTSYISTRENALNKKSTSFDIAEKTSIPSSRYIHNPRKNKRMLLKLSGLESYEGLTLNDGYYQYLRGDTVEIITPDISVNKAYNLPYKGKAASGYLNSSVLIDKDDPKIIMESKKIVKNEKNSLKAVKLINSWIYENLEKVPTVSIPTAVDVLESGKGDCNEHAVLFAAMARSVGIPTKVVLGLIYLEGRFYYHAWNEVFLGSWIPVDSTFGQVPVDATHIKLLEGDISKSPEILRVVGKLNLEIIESS